MGQQQGVGGGPKIRKFCGRHLSIAPNETPSSVPNILLNPAPFSLWADSPLRVRQGAVGAHEGGAASGGLGGPLPALQRRLPSVRDPESLRGVHDGLLQGQKEAAGGESQGGHSVQGEHYLSFLVGFTQTK